MEALKHCWSIFHIPVFFPWNSFLFRSKFLKMMVGRHFFVASFPHVKPSLPQYRNLLRTTITIVHDPSKQQKASNVEQSNYEQTRYGPFSATTTRWLKAALLQEFYLIASAGLESPSSCSMNVIKKDAKSDRGYDMRAQPRRRAKEENEQPLLLKKAFNMIDTCPDHLGRPWA